MKSRYYRILTGVVAIAVALSLGACQSRGAKRLPDAENPVFEGDGPGAVYVELAKAYLQEGLPSVAMSKAQKAVQVEPDNVEAHVILALAQSSMGYPEEAEKTLREAQRMAPNDPYVADTMGSAYCTNRRYDEALAQYESAANKPSNKTPWVTLTNAGLCVKDRNKSKAQDYLRQALQRNPRFGPALLALARLHLDSREYEQARTYVNRYFETEPPDPESLWLGYQVEKSLGNAKGAETYANLLKTRYPGAPQTYRVMGL